MNTDTREILDRSVKYGWVLEPEAKEIMRAGGIRIPEGRWIKKIEDIDNLPDSIFPAAAKVVSPAAMHKTESGGVRLNLSNSENIKNFFMEKSVENAFEGILVEKMVKGTELIFGSKNDPQFGTVVMAGLGGINVEIYKDVVFMLAPVTQEQALKALMSLKGIKLLTGFRGSAPSDLNAAASQLSLFSEVALSLAGRAESIDLNPVFCGPEGTWAADARIILSSD